MKLRVAAALLPFCLSFPISGQSQTTFLQNHLKARVVVKEAIAAMGGADALSSLQQLEYKYSGSIYNATQTFDPEKEVRPEPFSATLAFDYKDNRFYLLIDAAPAGITRIPSPVFFKNGTVYSTNGYQHQYTATKGNPGPTFDGLTRFMPPLLMKRLLTNIRTVEWVGEDSVHGRPVDIIEFSWDNTNRYRLDIDKADHKVRDVRALAIDPLIGDDDFRIEYIGEQTVGGLQFPKQAVSYRHGEHYVDITLGDVKVNQPPDASKFEIPAGYSDTSSVPTPTMGTEKVADNLYEVSGLGGGVYRSQFVDLGNSVVVFEAPISFAVSQQIVGAIRKTLGDKPIKYVVLSHFHDDHAGGIGAYVALGATVVTTKGNEKILTRYARVGSVLGGFPPHPELQPRFLDVTENKLEISGEEGRKVVVYQVSDAVHVKDMLVLYDPATHTIMDGDLYATFFPPSSLPYQRFAEWLKSPQAPDVVRIAGVHHPPMMKKDFLDLTSPDQN